MKKHLFITIITAFLLLSCGDSKEEIQTIKIKGLYSIELPEYLTKTTGLDNSASLQYQNTLREVYIMVIDEPKSKLEKAIKENALEDYYTPDLDGYAKLLNEGIETRASLDSVPQLISKKINGLNAKTATFTGNSQGIDIYWSLAFIEGKNNYYQVMIWTLADKKEQYKETMKAMINSFKETNKSKK
ncbi:hypothetical protein DVK85_04560 [Flavobacterium arcticum]|uniref:Lipoprotein n=1 Tax=Flavobacterium arcticum TaxID=1784713 RepID=A0A345HAD0_9FLAO|nr:hypothetical protein [Flavobacterium arcticum]AXG73540.1 hypothetical protein DVK85_04560 [Flavobacterium arcticum]KAF2513331.1 hypothetical protein E0W72_02615 [Flavobacterium arcticum]